MSKNKIIDTYDDVWYPLPSRHICCGCGLAHDLYFKRIKGKSYIRWRRNERSTAAVRRALLKRRAAEVMATRQKEPK